MHKSTETLLGGKHLESYQAVLEAICPHQHEFDLIVAAAGDLAQDQSLRPISISLKASQVFVRPASGCRATTISSPRCTARYRMRVSPAKRVFIGEQWQILLPDSQVFGVPHGELERFQLEWLERKLADALKNAIRCCCCIIIRYLRV